MQTRSKSRPSYIDPDRFYSREGFMSAAGLNQTRMREGRLQGVDVDWVLIGRRKYVRGADGIAYLLRLAELTPKRAGAST